WRLPKYELSGGRHGRWAMFGWNGEDAQVFLRAGWQSAPTALGGVAQLGPDREFFLSQEQENGVGPDVGVQSPRFDERLEQRGADCTLSNQIVFHAPELAGIRSRELQLGWSRCWKCRCSHRSRKMVRQPIERRFK